MIALRRWASSREAAFGVSLLILLVGAALLVRVVSRPGYEAIAEMVIEEPRARQLFGYPEEPNTVLLNQEREVLESAAVTQLAASFLNGGSGVSPIGDFPPIDCEGCVFDAALVESRLTIEIPKDSNQVQVRFRADDPMVARAGANAIVYAYMHLRSQEASVEVGVDVGITAVSLALTPDRRADRPAGLAVLGFLIAATVPLIVPWARVAHSWRGRRSERSHLPDPEQ